MLDFEGETTLTLETLALVLADPGELYWVESEDTVYKAYSLGQERTDLTGNGVTWIKYRPPDGFPAAQSAFRRRTFTSSFSQSFGVTLS